MNHFPQITLSMIREAQEHLKGVAQRTPLNPSTTISHLTKCNAFLKMENLQRTGSFKLRGAYNKVASLTEKERRHGIVAASAGNHAQGVALAAKEYGVQATICMPEVAPLSKIEATSNHGANVVLKGQFFDEAFAKAIELQNEKKLTFCHPFNDPMVIAGQGTIGLEILEDLPNTDVIVVPIGGGGLIAGIAIAAKSLKPDIRIVGVQTDNMPSMKESLRQHELTKVEMKSSLADGITVAIPGDLTFNIVEQYVDEIVTVMEAEISHAVLFLLEKIKTVAEGAGACSVAALLEGKIEGIEGKNVVAVISGGNIDVNKVGQIINNGLVQSWRKVFMDVIVPDRPRILMGLTKIIADANANILSVYHDRSQRDVKFGEVHVSLELETMNQAHVNQIIKAIQDSGYPVVVK